MAGLVYSAPTYPFSGKSLIYIEVRVEGELIAVKGGSRRANIALFEIPLLDLVTLEEELIYEIRWR